MSVEELVVIVCGPAFLVLTIGGLLARWVFRDERGDELSEAEYQSRLAAARAAIADSGREP